MIRCKGANCPLKNLSEMWSNGSFIEGVPEDYRGREGYREDFLGEDNIVPLPTIVRDAHQIVEFEFEGNTEHVLRYQHFSVVMNRKRRMCFYSAINIDGKRSRKATRTAWRIDPRIDKSLQIMYECYGNPPKFSRGHMTRREDPVWGTPAQALRGNSDSMHVTNATPQMQSFNAPIWLGLEDYALQNARKDKMSISVFTGPILRASDPAHYAVKIPRSFWKVSRSFMTTRGTSRQPAIPLRRTSSCRSSYLVGMMRGSARSRGSRKKPESPSAP